MMSINDCSHVGQQSRQAIISLCVAVATCFLTSTCIGQENKVLEAEVQEQREKMGSLQADLVRWQQRAEDQEAAARNDRLLHEQASTSALQVAEK